MSADPGPAPKIALDDGPYLRRMPNGIEARWICDGAVVRRVIPSSTQPVLVQPACGYDKAIRVDPKPAADPSVLPVGITRLVALSDVHGQYDLMIRLLQANGIIDGNRDWAWGNGHLVMTGDLFDRGEHVTEAFWLLYPRKTAKGKAREAWAKAMKGHTASAIIEALRTRLPHFSDEPRFVPHPATWLNQERWNDDIGSLQRVKDSRPISAAEESAYAMGLTPDDLANFLNPERRTKP